MATIESAFLDLRHLDILAGGDSPVHRFDPRLKVGIAAVFILGVVSFDKYVIAAMLPFGLFLCLIMGMGAIPAGVLLRKLILVTPFALLIGLFNPVFDQAPVLALGPVVVTGGWLSLVSILLRCWLTVGAVILLVATTGFNQVCMALERLGMPNLFAIQLLFVHRYLFVLMSEGQRMHRARTLRSFQGRGLGMKTVGSLLGGLLLRTLDRAHRIHLAMRCRGFDGTIRTRRPARLTGRDLLLALLAVLLLVAMRSFDCASLLGRLLTGAGA